MRKVISAKKIVIILCFVLALGVMVGLSSCSVDQIKDILGDAFDTPSTDQSNLTTPNTSNEETTPELTHEHTVAIDKAVPATCTTEGKTEGKHCSVCNEVLVKQEIVEALGHTEIVDKAIAATCTTDGKTEGKHCSTCNEIFIKQGVVKAFGHTEVIDEAIEATCTVEGKTEGKHCLVCNQVLVEQVAIKVEHTYISMLVEPTATTEGYTKYTCSNCNHTYTEDITTIDIGLSEYNRHLVGYTGGDNEELVISAVYQESGKWYRVTSIDNIAFGSCVNLRTVVIPDSVTSIHYHAFVGCSNLISVELPNSLTLIGDGAFRDCDNLRTVVIPASVTHIGNEAFSNCRNLRFVDIQNGVTSIGDFAFGFCNNLISITIPESVTSIGSLAFFSCFKLVEVYNLSSLTITKGADTNGHIGFYALDVHTSKRETSKLWEDDNGYIFYEDADTCYLIGYTGNAVELTLPANCNKKDYAIYQQAFYDCESLTKVTIPESVTSIGNHAFFECDKITNLTIADGVTSIGDYAFYWCYGITNLTIPDSVTSIGNKAFEGCINLTNLIMPSRLTSIGVSAFSGCRSLLSVTIPKGVTSIGSSAFSGCYNLVEVYNLSQLTIRNGSRENGEVGYYAIDIYTTGEAESKLWINDEGYVFYVSNELCYLMRYIGNETELVLPSDCNGKKYAIYKRAFFGCDNLTNVKFSDGVTSIGSEAFRSCGGLISVTLSNSITSIESSAFYQSPLKNVTFQGTVEQWRAIELNTYWNNWAPIAKVVCSNGDVEIKYVHKEI